MNQKQLLTATDLGGGDGGKGGAVHKLCCVKNAHTVLKVGGGQGSHGVRTSKGESFNFSQFGCGTFEGVRTHISDRMVIAPLGILNEGTALKYQHGILDAFNLLTVDENALCSTSFHGIASRLRELRRGSNPKGTVGVGIGEAIVDARLHPDLIIRARDIGASDLRDKLQAIREMKIKDLAEILASVDTFSEEDKKLAEQETNLLFDPAFVDWVVEQFQALSRQIRIVDQEYLRKEILSKDGVVVVESSHGVLTDYYHGFHPHTSKLRTVPQVILDLLEECDYDGQVVRLGVTRAYQIRHGAGPMVTESSEMVDRLLPGSNKDENRWQGKVRVGPLDLVALRYAISVCGGADVFDGLIITWFDQVETIGRWDLCYQYTGATDSTFFTAAGEIKVRRGADKVQLAYQQLLGEQLLLCKPKVTSIELPKGGRDGLIDLCKEQLEGALKVPVRMISFGPTEEDKECV